MKKKLAILVSLILTMVFVLPNAISANAISKPFTVNQANAKVLVNGVLTAFEAYNINGSNYFKLRDIAKVASGTEKQFEVSWSAEKKAINLLSDSAYTPAGGELAKGDGKPKQAILNSSAIYKDGSIVPLTAYTIGGLNFFKLRDLTQAFNIGLTWDGTTSTMGIDTSLDYGQESAPVGALSGDAIPLASRVLVNGVEKSFEAYTIGGNEYFKLGDLALALKGSRKGFSAVSYPDGKFTVIDTREDYYTTDGRTITGQLTKGDGTTKKASLASPKVYFNSNEIRSFTIYDINGTDYYQLNELMELLSCGVIRDKQANTINLDPSKAYEPEFLPIPQGSAAYQHLQQQLYDAYFEFAEGDGSVEVDGRITVPDNCTLYVPNGVTIETSSANRIFVGNNSTFYVRGYWRVEYPDRVLFPVSSQTKNAIYVDDNPLVAFQPGADDGSRVRVCLDGYDWAWNETDIPFESASISYGTSQYGVDQIILNFTRNKLDVKLDLKVVLYEQSGATHTLMYRNVRKNVDLMPQLANIIGEKIGKSTTINKIDIYNYYVGPHDNPDNEVVLKPISIPLSWNIVTSGGAPTTEKTAEFKDGTDIEHCLNIYGLSDYTYIAKYNYAALSNGVEKVNYGLISPENKYTVRHLDFADEFQAEQITGDRTNVALFKGQKGVAQNSYVFTVSPLSQDIMYTADFDYPSQASLTTEGNKTYLNFKMVNTKGSPSIYTSRYLMIRAEVKGAAGDYSELVYRGEVRGDKFDITNLLLSQYTKLYIHGYLGNIPSTKFVEIPLGSGVSTMESVKLGADTLVNISKSPLPSQGTGTITANVSFKNETGYSVAIIQISPTGKNSWTNLLSAMGVENIPNQLATGKSRVLPMTFNSSTLWDIKGTYSDLYDYDDNDEQVFRSFVVSGVDFSGISSAPGASIELRNERLTGKTVAIVTNNIIAPAPKPGDFGTDTIDVVLVAGDNVKTFNISDFSLVLDDGTINKYPQSDIRIVGISQTTAGNAKLTIARDLIPQVNLNLYFNQLNLYYKDYKVGKITFNNWY